MQSGNPSGKRGEKGGKESLVHISLFSATSATIKCCMITHDYFCHGCKMELIAREVIAIFW